MTVRVLGENHSRQCVRKELKLVPRINYNPVFECGGAGVCTVWFTPTPTRGTLCLWTVALGGRRQRRSCFGFGFWPLCVYAFRSNSSVLKSKASLPAAHFVARHCKGCFLNSLNMQYDIWCIVYMLEISLAISLLLSMDTPSYKFQDGAGRFTLLLIVVVQNPRGLLICSSISCNRSCVTLFSQYFSVTQGFEPSPTATSFTVERRCLPHRVNGFDRMEPLRLIT